MVSNGFVYFAILLQCRSSGKKVYSNPKRALITMLGNENDEPEYTLGFPPLMFKVLTQED